ncbi:hypothetical protein M8494_26640 [Serratia ureilytica]
MQDRYRLRFAEQGRHRMTCTAPRWVPLEVAAARRRTTAAFEVHGTSLDGTPKPVQAEAASERQIRRRGDASRRSREFKRRMNGGLPADWKPTPRRSWKNCRPTRPASPAARRSAGLRRRSARCCQRSSGRLTADWRRATDHVGQAQKA